MGILSGAVPQSMMREAAVKSDRGEHPAYFIGLSEAYVVVSAFGEFCRLCKGTKALRNGDKCFACDGTGKKTDQKVKLRYELRGGVIEEEEATYKLSGPTTSAKDNKALSPTTLFLRLRTLSGMRGADVTPEALDAWYSSLPQPIRIPCRVDIDDNSTGSALKITNVALRQAPATAQQQRQQPPPQQQYVERAPTAIDPRTHVLPEQQIQQHSSSAYYDNDDEFEDSIPF